MHLGDAADMETDLAYTHLAPGLALRHGRRPVAVEHLHELHAPGADRRGAAVLEHRDPDMRRPARVRLQPDQLTGPVEQDSVEADRAAVELDRGVDVADADADVVHSLEGAHATSAGCANSPASTSTSRIAAMLASSVTGSRGGRTVVPLGWPRSCISTFSWLW